MMELKIDIFVFFIFRTKKIFLGSKNLDHVFICFSIF